MTNEQKLTSVEEKLKRWMTRGRRAQTAIDKLLRQRQRLLKGPKVIKEVKPEVKLLVHHDDLASMPSNTPSVIPLPELDAFFQIPAKQSVLGKEDADLTIPPELKRTEDKPKSGSPGPKLLSDLINKPFIDARKKKRLEKMDEKRRGRSMFDKSDMPLTGRDALKAIRAKKGG
jgi:hypothetical protein